jgi:transcriptional regulator with XRE-family HTH domain
MSAHTYSEQDYTFGQMILTLRTTIGLTQEGLARLLHVSRRTVGGWEAGSSYPKAENLRAFIELCVQQQAFPSGREAEEITVLWHASHQKVLLDTQWLSTLLSQPRPDLALLPQAVEETKPLVWPLASSTPGSRVDWGEAFAVPTFYGREQELALWSRSAAGL